MIKKISLFFTCIVLFSCNGESSSKSKQDSSSKKFEEMIDTLSKLKYTHKGHFEEVHVNQDSIKQLILKQHANGINTYIFSLEGNFSAEGNEGKAFYRDKKIHQIEITFYGEMGKAIYSYNFTDEKINVTQQRFSYKTNFTEVKSAQDIIKDEEINFTTDLNGKIIEGHDSKIDLDTFMELKKVVPFDLI